MIKAILDVTFAQKENATKRLSTVVFFSPGCNVLFLTEFAVNTNASGSRDVSATSIDVIPWMAGGLKK